MKISNNEREHADLNREKKMKCCQAKEDHPRNKCLEAEQIYNVAPKVAHKKSVRSLANTRAKMGNMDA